ncbi:MAG: long-chain fatty acid--CoA ligase [Deltaproteobacteria bacterium]|nr:long-chain fatty acid--CoA ligase [Deltaproteobacteria bacterium]
MKDPQTILEVFLRRVKKEPKTIAFKQKENDVWKSTTWEEYQEIVRSLAASLKDLGVQKGDRVAILSATRCEWALSDVAILSLGAATVPIYPSNTASECEYVLSNSGTKIVIVEDEAQYNKIKNLNILQKIICFNDFKRDPVLSWKNLVKEGRQKKFDIEASIKTIESSQMATIVYTSGTTGNPKGVVLTHDNFVSECLDIQRAFPLSHEDVSLTFLPFAHIFARVEHLSSLVTGWCLAYAESIEKVALNMGEVKPTLLFSVPRIYEKVHTKILAKVESGSFLKKEIFNWAVKVGSEVSSLLEKKRDISPLLKFQYQLAQKLVFNKIKQTFGGRIKFLISGGAPLAKELARFFHAAGLLIVEGYGLTETTAAAFGNLPTHYHFGTVGLPLGEVQVKISEEDGYPQGEGEILIKSRKVFKEYYKNPQATKEVFINGWFATGDIGRIEENGSLRITDRKKDIIVTSSGKNVAPQNIENYLKSDPYISQVMVYGDKRNYLTALVTLNREEIEKFAHQKRIIYGDWFELVASEDVRELIQEIISEKNKTLSSYQTIKKFKILEQDFSIESGELTPTLKVKRKYCNEKYKNILDSMYH